MKYTTVIQSKRTFLLRLLWTDILKTIYSYRGSTYFNLFHFISASAPFTSPLPACTIDRDFCDRDSRSDFGVLVLK